MNTQISNQYTETLNMIQVWINMVLFYRKTVFSRKIKVANQGPLETYITDFVKSIDQYQGKIRQIEIHIFNQQEKRQIQKVVFTIQQFPPQDKKQKLSKLKIASFIQDLEKQLSKQSSDTLKYFELQMLMQVQENIEKIKNLTNEWGLAKMETQEKQPNTCSFKSNTSEYISSLYL